MLVDEAKITVIAGQGGKGAAAFSKVKETLGPTGGNGGTGGNIFIEGVADLSALRNFRFKKTFKAENGENGKSTLNDGRNGADLVLKVPVGTVCKNLQDGQEIEIIKIGQKELVAKGGKGGRGNWSFRSAINTSPKEFQQGRAGQAFELQLELKMIADIGLVGLPNAGKSSLLNELTRAKSKVANYAFTTLEPHLGAYYDLIIADIPGLIEGASDGKGLGTKFLRHIERTKTIFHLVSAESENAMQDYLSVRKELSLYSEKLSEKPEFIFISKSDSAPKEKISEIESQFAGIGKKLLPISIIDPESIGKVRNILDKIAQEKKA